MAGWAVAADSTAVGGADFMVVAEWGDIGKPPAG